MSSLTCICGLYCWRMSGIFLPIKSLQVSLLSKYVGKQFMGNIDAEKSTLEAYFINDINVNYEWKINKGINEITN